jgi:hypothetical protein
MEAIKCRLCGTRHWGICPGVDALVSHKIKHSVQDAAQEPPVKAKDEKQESVEINKLESVDNRKYGDMTTYRYRDKDRRREYMREYMRAKRAKCSS